MYPFIIVLVNCSDYFGAFSGLGPTGFSLHHHVSSKWFSYPTKLVKLHQLHLVWFCSISCQLLYIPDKRFIR